MPSAEVLLRALDGRPLKLGGWLVRCPAHEDRTPSLSVSLVNGRVLVYCHAGCTQEAVIGVLRERGLWEQGKQRRLDKVEKGVTRTRASAEEAWRQWEKKTGLARNFWESLQVTYDEAGQRLCFPFTGTPAVKYRPWPPQSGSSPKYMWDTGVQLYPPLWPVPTVENVGRAVVLASGETDCATLRFAGYKAFAGTKGEGTPPKAEVLAALRALGVETVAVLYDADAEGAQGALKAASSCAAAGLQVRVVVLPAVIAARGGKDVNDLWHLTSYTVTAFQAQLDAVLAASVAWEGEPRTTKPAAARQVLAVAEPASAPPEPVRDASWPEDGVALEAFVDKSKRAAAGPKLALAWRDLAARLLAGAFALDGQPVYAGKDGDHPAVTVLAQQIDAASATLAQDVSVTEKLATHEKSPLVRVMLESRFERWLNDYTRLRLAAELVRGRPLGWEKKQTRLPCAVCLGVVPLDEARRLFEVSTLLWEPEAATEEVFQHDTRTRTREAGSGGGQGGRPAVTLVLSRHAEPSPSSE